MMYFWSFIFCGTLCLIAQFIIDNTKLSAGHVTSLFVVIGAFLDVFDIYDNQFWQIPTYRSDLI